jgi:hypothetical protein
VWVYFWFFCSVPLVYMSIFVPVPCCFVIVALQHNLNLDIMILSTSLCLLRIALAIQGLSCFHMNFRIVFSGSMKNIIGIFMGIALNP